MGVLGQSVSGPLRCGMALVWMVARGPAVRAVTGVCDRASRGALRCVDSDMVPSLPGLGRLFRRFPRFPDMEFWLDR